MDEGAFHRRAIATVPRCARHSHSRRRSRSARKMRDLRDKISVYAREGLGPLGGLPEPVFVGDVPANAAPTTMSLRSALRWTHGHGFYTGPPSGGGAPT